MATDNNSPGIDERTLEFACQINFFVRTIAREPGSRVIIEQLVDAAGSVGTNRQESSGGSTRTDIRRILTAIVLSTKRGQR